MADEKEQAGEPESQSTEGGQPGSGVDRSETFQKSDGSYETTTYHDVPDDAVANVLQG
jgi:hypothetical protein